MTTPIDMVTAQGYDLQFGVNTLGMVRWRLSVIYGSSVYCTGHFFFTKLLLPALAEGAKGSPDGHSRVVNTSSSVHDMVKTINFETLKDGPARRKKSWFPLYAQSKLVSRDISTR